MRLYIIRHGDPDYAADALTPRGVAEAEALAPYLEAEGINEIHSSPHGRARLTAAPAAKRLGLDVEIEEWTRELRLPSLYDNTLAAWNVHGHDVRTAAYLANPRSHRAIACLPHDEIEACLETMHRASDEFLAKKGFVREGGVYRVTRENRNKVAMVCHGGFGPTWLSLLLEIPFPLMWTGFFMHTTSVTIIVFDERSPGIATPRCLMFGALPHLYAAKIEPCQAGIVGNYF